MTAEDVGDDPGRDVGRAAGGKGNDDRDRPGRVILGLRATGCYHNQCGCHQDQRRRDPILQYRLPDAVLCHHRLVNCRTRLR